MVVVVVGARGFVGRALVAELERHGHRVQALSSSAPGGLDPASGLPSGAMRLAVDATAVVYLAQSPHHRGGEDMAWHLHNVNVAGAVAVTERARAAGAGRLIYASTGSVYAPSFAPLAETDPVAEAGAYARSKIAAERALASVAGIEVTVVRPFGVFGPGQVGGLVPTIAGRVRRGEPVTLAPRRGHPEDDGGLRVSFCYVDDAVSMLRGLVERGGPPRLNLAGPTPRSLRSVAEAIGERVGVEPRFEPGPEPRAGDLWADVELLRRTLAPRWTPFEAAIARTLDPTA